MPFQLTGAGKKALKQKAKKHKKLGVTVNATYTPTGGSPKTQVLHLQVQG